MRNNFFLLIFFFMAGCGFSSGLYKDILKAQAFIEKKDFQNAVSVYESILLRKPSKTIQIKVNYQLGALYSNHLNDYEKSLIHYNNIINHSNEPSWQVKSLEQVGKILFEGLKNYEKSAEVYKNLISFIPKLERQSFYKFRYALSLFHNGDLEKSEKVFAKLMLEKEDKAYAVKSYYYLGLINFYNRKWKESISYWYEYLKREKRKNEIIKTKFLIANAYESSEKLKKAYNIYYSIIGEYPNPAVIRGRLNSLYQRRVGRKR